MKAASGAAGTRIVPAEPFKELLVTVDDLDATFYAGFRRETFASFAGNFEQWLTRVMQMICHTASVVDGLTGVWTGFSKNSDNALVSRNVRPPGAESFSI